MKLTKKILLVTAIIFIVIQFIQPGRNINDQTLTTDISKIVAISDSIQSVLVKSCYDCHSNNTSYPWYSNIQPMGWLMAKHIRNGKNQLNFSDFGDYSLRRQSSKMTEIENILIEDKMPLTFYKLMHNDARLSLNEKTIIIRWAQKSNESISVK